MVTARVNHAAPPPGLIKVLLYLQSERGGGEEKQRTTQAPQIMYELSKNRSPGRTAGLSADSK